MWPITLASPSNVAHLFSTWLDKLETQDEISDMARDCWYGKPCLLDLLTLWIQRDRTILAIPSHAALLVGVIAVVESWLVSGKTHVNNTVLVRDFDTGEPLVIERLFTEESSGMPPGAFDADHPLLNPLTFDLAKIQFRRE